MDTTILLIPGKNWVRESTENMIFSDRDYEGKKSAPEWGLTINLKNLEYLEERYEISKTLKLL